MKFGKLILVILLFIGSTALVAQEDECTRYKAIGGNAYKVKDYQKVTMAYIKALENCESLEMVFYNPFIYSIKKSMKDAPDAETEAKYLDTLIYVYDEAQKTHGIQKDWQAYLGYYYLMQGKPGYMQKADEAYKIGMHFEGKDANVGMLKQYYANIYNLWVQETDAAKKAEYKKRLIAEYFKLSEYVSKGEMDPETVDFLSIYMEKAITDCESLLPEINTFMKDLPSDKEAKKGMVKNFMALIEKQECTDSKEYAMLVDTIIAIDPSVDAVLAKAKLLLVQGKTSEAIKAFEKALGMSKDAEQKSDIELKIASAYYHARSYQSAHNAGINVSGKNSGKGYEIAAKSVNTLMNDCGVSTFDRKANNYYAVELAKKSGNSSLVEAYKQQCPTSTDLFNEDKEAGEKVTLDCWNKTFIIELY
jgi:tetratricopeptide (TPR) repeat protein